MGTELLLGQIVDTNSSWIGEQLALAGIDCLYQAKVGDNRDRIVAALRQALDRADAVIVCGGLGPDAGRHHPGRHRRGDGRRAGAGPGGRGSHPGPVRVAVPHDAGRTTCARPTCPSAPRVMAQMPGTAPGLVCARSGDKVIYAMPGVPYEMQEMVRGHGHPRPARRAGETAVIRSRTLRTWGQTESGLAEVAGPVPRRAGGRPGTARWPGWPAASRG